MDKDIGIMTAIVEKETGCINVCDFQEGTVYGNNYNIQKNGKYISISIYADDKAVLNKIDRVIKENIIDKSVLENCIG